MSVRTGAARLAPRLTRGLCIAFVGALLAACGGAPAPQAPGTEAPRGELARPAADAVRHVVSAEASEIRFIVRRAGTLARLGHNHVIVARGLAGDIALAPELRRSTVSLRLPVAQFEVDPPAVRAELGEDFAPLPAQAVLATRRNMLGARVLDAVNHAQVRIDTVAVAGTAEALQLTLRITLRGVSRDVVLPVSLARAGDTLVARAQFEIRQSDFGLTPLSVLGGALQVADEIAVRLRIEARAGL